jgi:hypothetical protein
LFWHFLSSIRNSSLTYTSFTRVAASYVDDFVKKILVVNLITSGTICQLCYRKKTITGVAQIAKIASVIAFAKQTYVHHLSSSLFSDKQSMQRITKPRICASAARLHVRQSEIVDLRIAVKQFSHTLVGVSFLQVKQKFSLVIAPLFSLRGNLDSGKFAHQFLYSCSKSERIRHNMHVAF